MSGDATPPAADTAALAPFRRFLGFDASSARVLAQLGPVLEPDLDRVAARFYDRIRATPEAVAIFTGGEVQMRRQHAALRGWLAELFSGDYGAEYVASRHRVGQTHLRIGVEQQFVIAAFNWIRQDLLESVASASLPEAISRADASRAINAVLDHDLGLLLESYWTDLHARLSRVDRLALVGRFTAAINHELRNPLGVVQTSSYIVRADLGAADALTELRAEHLDRIRRALDRANAIVSGMLDLMRIREPKSRPVSMREFLDETLAEAVLAGVSRVEVIDEGVEPGNFDPGQVCHVVENLVRNALDAAGDDGHVRLRWRTDARGTTIRVEDDGPGIAAENRDRIFDPLFTTKAFGTGLGLTLSRAIVEAHGGTLEVSAGIDGEGAGFEVILPRFLGVAPRLRG